MTTGILSLVLDFMYIYIRIFVTIVVKIINKKKIFVALMALKTLAAAKLNLQIGKDWKSIIRWCH